MKYLLPLLILINCHEIKGVFEWTVVGKVTDYGQNVTLFCRVPNCCPEDSGWDRWTPNQRTLFIDVKTGRSNKKYDGKVLKDGYTLVIQNLTKNDLNVSYSCLYGVTLGERKFLLEEDVFIYTKQTNNPTVISAGQIAGIVVGVVLVTVFVALFVFHLCRPKHSGTGSKEIAMDSRERTKLMEKIADGNEIRRYVRIHVIGKGGVGKTSLVHRLLGRNLKGLIDTDGIEIHKNCQINTSNGEWVVGKETEKQAMIKRLKKIMQDGNVKTQKTNIVDGQSYPSIKKVSGNQMHREPYLSNTDLSGRNDNEEAPLLSEEQRDSEEVVVNVAVCKNNDELETKHADIISVAANNKLKGNKIITTDPVGDSRDKPSNEQSLTEDKKHHKQEPPSIIISTENETVLNNKEIEMSMQELTAKYYEILLNAKEREKITEDLEGFVECGIWDFAGQKEYLGTHQTFFTPQAIYVLVADIESALTDNEPDNDFDSIGKYIDFWFDSIHCFCTNASEKKLCPPVFMVFTGTDKDVKFDKPHPEHEETLLSFDDRKKDHMRGVYHISNKRMNEKDSKEIMRLKEDISNFAKKKDFFFEELPTEWIQLETALEVIKDVKDKLHVLSWAEMEELAKKSLIKETNKLDKFLTYQHKIGNIIFLENVKDYIILRPSWLVECFRCLIFDSEKRDYELVSKSAWDEITSNGKLSMEIIDSLFQKETGLKIEKFKQYLLKLLEQFNIIIQPHFADINHDGQNLDSYYMPCVIEKTSSYESIKAYFIDDKTGNVRITPWLVLAFKFLPLAYFNHVLFFFIKNYTVCGETSGRPAIYRGKLVFHIDEFRKCLICFSNKAISLQLWEWSAVDERVYNTIFNELCDCIENLKGQFSQDISYNISAKCSDGDYWKREGRISIENINKEDKYFCEEHRATHSKKDVDLENIWFKHAIEREKKQKSEHEEKSLEEKIPISENRKEWPPGNNEQHVMLADPVIRIRDNKSPWFIHEYGKEHVYSMQGHCRGKVFIINNVLFGGRMIDGDSSNIDAKNLSKMFEELHFSVQRKDNLTGNDMRSFLQTGAEQIEKEQNIECVILIIMSYGVGRRIYGIDYLPVEVTSLTDCFSTDNCPSLYEKPRLIFIQACRAESNAMENRSLEYPSPHFLIAYATPEGTKRWLNKDVGSWFMNALIWTFKYHAHEEELRHLLIRVNRMVANKETGSKEMTVALTMSNLRKKFYFFPGIHGMPPELF